MRVMQLIDSLEPGGAERMAVIMANGLSEKIEGSYLCVTRKEGFLKTSILPKVHYNFLNKKRALDIRALLKLKHIVKKENISIIHAHTTSYFFGTLLKIIYPKISLIWHEHQGKRIKSNLYNNKILYMCSFFFNTIIVVNKELQFWCKKNLATKDVRYLPNFISVNEFKTSSNQINKTIVCLANLKEPKNHLNLLAAFKIVHSHYPEWKLHLIGKDYNDSYSKSLKDYIKAEELNEQICFYGNNIPITDVLPEASIGVLSSDDEGQPMALLEYGASGLAVITTNVGYCKEVIGNFGNIVETQNPIALSQAIIDYIDNESLRMKEASDFKNYITTHYSLSSVLPKLLTIYKN